MLNSHIDSLIDDSLSNGLAHNHADGAFRHVEHASRSSVIEFVRHAALNRSVGLNAIYCRFVAPATLQTYFDIDEVSHFIDFQVDGCR